MMPPQAVIFDLGGTLVQLPGANEDMDRRWILSYQSLTRTFPEAQWPDVEVYVHAMQEAEDAHWQRVVKEQWSGPPTGLLSDGFRRLGYQVNEQELLNEERHCHHFRATWKRYA